MAFPIDFRLLPEEMRRYMIRAGETYLDRLQMTSRMMTKSGLRIQTFNYASCKDILDEIDRVLGRYYGLTGQESDFIINYDIKYRMGQEANEHE
jgi:hypothetical protein